MTPWCLTLLLVLLLVANAVVWMAVARTQPAPPKRRELWRERLDMQASTPPCALCHDPMHVWEEHVRRPWEELRQRADEERWLEGEW